MAAVFKTHSLTNMVVSNCYRQHWAIREMVVGSNPGCFHCWLTSRHVTHLEVREIQISYRTSHAGRENLHHQLLLGGVSAFTWLETSDHVTVCAVCCQQDSRPSYDYDPEMMHDFNPVKSTAVFGCTQHMVLFNYNSSNWLACVFFVFFWTCFSLRNRSDSTWTWTQTLPLIRLGGVGGLEQIPGERVQIRSGRDKTLRGRFQTWTSPNLMRIKNSVPKQLAPGWRRSCEGVDTDRVRD